MIAWARDFLDTHFPLTGGSHADATAYVISAGALSVQQASGEPATLADPSQLVGYTGNADAPESVALCHNGLHIEIQVDRSHAVGATDAAGVKDVCLESALTTIQDCEDSVAAVDAEEVIHYHDWVRLNTAVSVLQLPSLRRVISEYENTSNGRIVISYPGGDDGNAWAEELRGWLVSLGIGVEHITLQPGSGVPQALVISAVVAP